MNNKIDAILILSFGGPEGMEDVMPFLDNVLAGKNVPLERKKEVARHYDMFGGVSPINAQNRELKKLLENKLKEVGLDFPVFWGNRNWKPYIKEAFAEMMEQGVKNALVYVTSAYGSYSGCRQYLENIEKAKSEIEGCEINFQKLPAFYNHPNFIDVNVLQIKTEIEKFSENERKNIHLAFTAHSIPMSMSQRSPYLNQLQETCGLVAEKLNIQNWKLVFQSRSGPPSMPWLEPDICDHLKNLSDLGVKNIVISPIGFVSDHMEVIYDLDVEAAKKAKELKMNFYRAKTGGNHPLMIEMIVDLIRNSFQENFISACKPNCCSR